MEKKQILLHSFLKWGENCTSMIKPLLELVNTDLLLLPRSLSSSVREIMFKVHLKEKSTGEARKDSGKSFRGL